MLMVLLLLSIFVGTSEGRSLQFCFQGCRIKKQIVTCDVLLKKDFEKFIQCIENHSGTLVVDIRNHNLKCSCEFLEFCTSVKEKPQTVIFHDEVCHTKEVSICGKMPNSTSVSGERHIYVMFNGIVFDLKDENYEQQLKDMYDTMVKILSSLTSPSTREEYINVEDQIMDDAMKVLHVSWNNPDYDLWPMEEPTEEEYSANGVLESDQVSSEELQPEVVKRQLENYQDVKKHREDYQHPEEDKDGFPLLLAIIIPCIFLLIVILILYLKGGNNFSPKTFFENMYDKNASALTRKKRERINDLEEGLKLFLSKNDNKSNKRAKDPGRNWKKILNSEEAVPLLLNEQSESEAEAVPLLLNEQSESETETSYPSAYDRKDLETGKSSPLEAVLIDLPHRSDVALDLSSVPDEQEKENRVNWLSPKTFLQYIYNKNSSALGRRRKDRIIDLKKVPFVNQSDSESDDQHKDSDTNEDDEDVNVSCHQYDSEAGVSRRKDDTLDSSQLQYESMVNEVLDCLPSDDPLILSIQKLCDNVHMFKKDLKEEHIFSKYKEPEQIFENHDDKFPDTLPENELRDPVESLESDEDEENSPIDEITLDLLKEQYESSDPEPYNKNNHEAMDSSINEVTLDLSEESYEASDVEPYNQNDPEAETSPINEATQGLSKVLYKIMVNEDLKNWPQEDPLIMNIQKLYSKMQMFKKDLEENSALEMDREECEERENFTRIHKNSNNLMGVSRKSSTELNKRGEISERSPEKTFHRLINQEQQDIKRSQKRVERDVKILPERSPQKLKYREQEEGIIYTSPKISHGRIKMNEERIVHMSPKVSRRKLRKRKELDSQKLQEIPNRKSLMREKGIFFISPEISRDIGKSSEQLHKRSRKRAEAFFIMSPKLSSSSNKPEELIFKISPKISLSSLRKKEEEILKMSPEFVHRKKKYTKHRPKRNKQRDVSTDTDTD